MSKKTWTRPADVPYPSVWATVEGRKPMQNGKIPRFRVQDVPKELENDVINYMTTIFLSTEAYCQHLKLHENPGSVEAWSKMYREILDFGIAIVCLLDNPQDFEDLDVPLIAGCNMTFPVVKGNPPVKVKDEAAAHVFALMQNLSDRVDCFEKYNVSVQMYAFGLSVHPLYRGQGLGEQLLRARIAVGRAVGIPVTTTIFSSPHAVHIAKRIGFEMLIEEDSREYLHNGKPVFDGPNCTKSVLAAMRLD